MHQLAICQGLSLFFLAVNVPCRERRASSGLLALIASSAVPRSIEPVRPGACCMPKQSNALLGSHPACVPGRDAACLPAPPPFLPDQSAAVLAGTYVR